MKRTSNSIVSRALQNLGMQQIRQLRFSFLAVDIFAKNHIAIKELFCHLVCDNDVTSFTVMAAQFVQ